MGALYVAAWKHGARNIRCLFFEATGKRTCPFHAVRIAETMTILGPVMLYAAKRTKFGIRGSYKQKRKTRRKK